MGDEDKEPKKEDTSKKPKENEKVDLGTEINKGGKVPENKKGDKDKPE